MWSRAISVISVGRANSRSASFSAECAPTSVIPARPSGLLENQLGMRAVVAAQMPLQRLIQWIRFPYDASLRGLWNDKMSKVARSIRRGLEEAVAYARGEAKESAYRVHVPALIDVRAIRTKLGMTQEEFAGRFGFSVNTLRHWEQGKRQPEGPTRAYLLVIERATREVQKALHAS